MDRKNFTDKGLRGEWKFALILAVLLLAAAALWIYRRELKEIQFLSRPEAGKGSREVELDVRLEDTGEVWNWKGLVAARIYSAAELEERMETARSYIREHLIREGDTPDRVVQGVNLITEVPDTDVKVNWNWQEKELLDRNGNVRQEQLTEAVLLILTAELSCQDLTERLEIPIYLVPETLSESEQRKRDLEKELDSRAGQKQEGSELELPADWEGTPVSFAVWEENSYWLLPLMLAGVLLLRRVHEREEGKKKEQERKEEILLQYPDFVSRFVVLMGAGMNLAAAWKNLSEDYERRTGAEGSEGEKRMREEALYEEVCLTARSLQNGEQERQAYETFGRRTGVQACQRFAAILLQNLRLGNEQMLQQLEYEAAQALEDRKAQARRRGEEMGTKLLLPMMVQLLLVLVMVMLPAFMNM